MNMRKMAGASLAMALMMTVPTGGMAQSGWTDDLRPIGPADWNYERAAHLLERAGFGGTPEEIERLAAMTPADAVAYLVNFEDIDNSHLKPFDHSGVHDSGLEPFPPSRPAVTDLAKETGEALGIRVKPAGNRRLQPVVNKFFYWLRASVLETNRVSYWWANRMVQTKRPLQEKMALFWHGHFAVTESKIRDYRKGLGLLELFYQHGTDNFKTLMLAVAKDPAMLSFLDAGVNVKGAPNENFAREIMELFTMGVGNYTETDIREAARAFTGWNYEDLKFVVNDTEHDDGEKTLLGQTGTWDGDGTINIILEQPVTSEYIAGKIYRYFVREDISADTKSNLGKIFADNNYQIRPLLETIFLSRDFYGDRSVGTHIKSPVGLAISTFRKLGLKEIPGVPDFNRAMSALGQLLFRPPTVAGWAQGRSWITPGLLLERGNFARDILFPDINFIPPDRYNGSGTIRSVAARIADGMDITSATMPVLEGSGEMAESNMLADRDEDFNTRYGSFRGWQMAIQRVKPISRHAAQINLTEMVLDKGLEHPEQVVDYFVHRFMRVTPAETERQMLVDFLTDELGTSDIRRAETYLEDPLRLLLHLIMSQPEYQLG